MRQGGVAQPDKNQVLAEWKSVVDEFIREVEEWSADKKVWIISRSYKEITEELLGTYEVPVLNIEAPNGRLHLEPLARVVLGGHGTIEFYAWPTLYRVRLIRNPEDQSWKILTDSGIKWPFPWNKENFYVLAQELLDANEG